MEPWCPCDPSCIPTSWKAMDHSRACRDTTLALYNLEQANMKAWVSDDDSELPSQEIPRRGSYGTADCAGCFYERSDLSGHSLACIQKRIGPHDNLVGGAGDPVVDNAYDDDSRYVAIVDTDKFIDDAIEVEGEISDEEVAFEQIDALAMTIFEESVDVQQTADIGESYSEIASRSFDAAFAFWEEANQRRETFTLND